jgi:homoserine O-acetyltransferase/O-succinyltransferase
VRDEFSSSDSMRGAFRLSHARTLRLDEPLDLESGGRLSDVTVCYETYGRLNDARDNAVLVCHALSGDSHVAQHDPDDEPGWWDIMVGPGCPIDTERYFVVCANLLGGCRGTTGPSFVDPTTGRPYGADFPVVTVADMVNVQARLVEHLGIDKLLAVVGGSLGGFQVLDWATRFPDRLAGCIPLATSPRLSSQGIAFDVVGRNAIRQDANFRNGQYYGHVVPEAGLAIARMLAHITYLSSESMQRKFDPTRFQPRDVPTAFEKKFSVGSYLAYQGDRFVERFDANCYVTLSTAMDLFDLGDSFEKLRQAVRPSTCRWLILSFTSDWLYPPSQSRDMVDALVAEGKAVSYCDIESSAGHDSFLLPEGMDVGGPMVGSFLAHLCGQESATQPCEDLSMSNATSIFHGRRLDYEMILDLMPPRASVVDLGCGNGELLSLLRERGHGPLMGVEIDQDAIAGCVARGLDVIQADLDYGLSTLTDKQFDIAVLSQTLQSIEDVTGILAELVRVGKQGVVSFPNFAHRPMREMLFTDGRAPKEPGVLPYDWYNTPNRRFLSILDFQELCASMGIRITRQICVDSRAGREVTEDPNLNADFAIVVVTR